MKVECVHRAIACNRGTGTLDVHGKTDKIVYAGSNNVLIATRTGSQYNVTETQPCKSNVKSVAWVRNCIDLVVYEVGNGKLTLWDITTKTLEVKVHGAGIKYVCAAKLTDTIYIVSVGAKVLVHTKATSQDLQLLASMDITKNHLGLCCAVTEMKEVAVLALATTDSQIHLYSIGHELIRLITLVGHEDWVRGLDFLITPTSTMLCSGSNDHYVRIWNIRIGDNESGDDFSVKREVYTLGDVQYSVNVESILLGHENWVTSVRWINCGSILTASMDKTLIIWTQDSDMLWSESVHVGEVGGNNLGLFGAFPTSKSDIIISHSFQGAIQAWQNTSAQAWTSIPMPGGHFGPVKSISWSPEGWYLLSASADQSVRVTAQWSKHGWYEVARTQVHGHDMSCVAVVTNSLYISGSEEKVLRVFEGTGTFFSNLNSISGIDCTDKAKQLRPLGAHIPALGLSNKAICEADMKQNVMFEDNPGAKDYDIPYQVAFAPVELTQPPVEEILLQRTLWPELQKLYGHGYEVYQCCAAPDGSMVASSCKASNQQFAAVLLWDTSTWRKITELLHHNLTVTRLRFSPDSSKLLSVSRDREWAVFSASSPYQLLAASNKGAHSRIIWDCSWFNDSISFLTVSRDKKAMVWEQEGSSFVKVADEKFDSSITAVDVSRDSDEQYIALGLETGQIIICLQEDSKIRTIYIIPLSLCPTLTINTMLWRPDASTTLALCSDDNSLLIFKLTLHDE